MTYLVTGTSSGIGEFIVKHLIESTDHKVIGVSRRPGTLQFPQYTHIQGDLTEPATVKAIVEACGENLDGVVFNAGILDISQVRNQDMSKFKQVFDVNLFSVVELTQALLPALNNAKGRAIYVSSGASVSGYGGWSAYGASKAALNLVVKTLAKEEPNITFASVAPGVVDTPMQTSIRTDYIPLNQMDAADTEKFKNLKQKNQLVSPEDSGRMYANLAIRASPDLNGGYFRYTDLERYA